MSSKISQLNEYDAATAAADDLLVIVDTSAVETQKLSNADAVRALLKSSTYFAQSIAGSGLRLFAGLDTTENANLQIDTLGVNVLSPDITDGGDITIIAADGGASPSGPGSSGGQVSISAGDGGNARSGTTIATNFQYGGNAQGIMLFTGNGGTGLGASMPGGNGGNMVISLGSGGSPGPGGAAGTPGSLVASNSLGSFTAAGNVVTVAAPSGLPYGVQISHDGTNGRIVSKDGAMIVEAPAGLSAVLSSGQYDSTYTYIRVSSALTLGNNLQGINKEGYNSYSSWNMDLKWTSGAGVYVDDTGITRSAARVVKLTDGSTGGGTLSSPMLTPAQITSDQNDYAPGVGRYIRVSSDASRNITGIVAGVDGQECWLINVGSQNVVLKHQDAASAAANRFLCDTGADITLAASQRASLVYDGTTQRWRVYG